MTEQSPDPTEEIGYADAVAELDRILDQLDDDEVDIDVLSTLVERAAALIGVCRSRITAAQTKVESIVENLEGVETSK